MSKTMAMNLLEDWCRGMEVDIHRSLLVTGIPEDCGQAEIEETLNGVLSPLGPYRVLNKIFVREENVKAALIEVGEGVNLSTIPREFPGRGGVWRVVCRDPTQDAEFLKNLNEFLDAEGRTWEDVVRLLQLNHPTLSQNQHQPPENWAEALGVLLGAVVQIIFCMDAEIRSREEARAHEAAEFEEMTAWALAAGKKVKKEPGLAAEVGSALKTDNPNNWNATEDQHDPPKPLVRKAGAKTRSRRKKQKKNPKQEAVPWKKPKGINSNSTANLEDPEAGDAESMAISEPIKGSRKPCVKQEELALKKPMAKCAWKGPREPSQDARAEAESPGGASESDQDGGHESPPKKKAMAWVSAKNPMRKKKKVSLGPVSYVLVDSEDGRKKPVMPKKGPGSRREASVQKAPRGQQSAEATASTSRDLKAKPEGSPRRATNGENDSRSDWAVIQQVDEAGLARCDRIQKGLIWGTTRTEELKEQGRSSKSTKFSLVTE
uniref:paraneoplastic antigen-like protein 8A isoform X1 n=1 Tax=Macaca mulatta TaxID=9544 RepID=UPI0010A2A01C|nr:paraneoplastic antigen-like protein 8A isoform X1 [Macaca mulatta]XP_028694534.1 paraneoplastic antigen-like protein 8A isoform X1 [Macaca mulatta]